VKPRGVAGLMGERPSLIAKCALLFASNWYLKPGETKALVWTADAPWRPYGLRFGPNAPNLRLVQLKTAGLENLVQPLSAALLTPLMTTEELQVLRSLDNVGTPTTGIILDVPYTKFAKRLPIRDPSQWLNLGSLKTGQKLTLTVQNIGAVPELVDNGAVFFAKPYTG
jgi:hypothetical protein